MVFATDRIEKEYWLKGYELICGIDEVGRGSFAGPLVAGAVVFAQNSKIPPGIADSKLLSPNKRAELSVRIKDAATSWAVGVVDVPDINKFGIIKTTQIAYLRAVGFLSKVPDFFLIDAFYIRKLNKKRQLAIKKGDRLSVSIAAASIIAKVYRDELMKNLCIKFPGYKLCKNKGYGTREHREAIKRLGLSRMHRKSFDLRKYSIL